MLKHKHPDNLIIDDAAYLVTTVTSKREKLFSNSENAFAVISCILTGRTLYHYWLLGFVVMPDHLHVVLKPRNKTLSEVMKSLKGASARAVNRRRGVEGVVWQKRYLSRPIASDRFLTKAIQYIEANPIRAEITECVNDYPYSSVAYPDFMDFDII